MTTPHDRLLEAMRPRLEQAVRELGERILPALAKWVDWSTLKLESGQFGDPSPAQLPTDLVYTVKIGARTACIYVQLEPASAVDRMMPLRLLRAMTSVWSRFEETHPGEPLPVIIPLVFHLGGGGSTAPTRFRELFALDEALWAAVAPFVPDFAFVLEDLSVADAARRVRIVAELAAALRPWVSSVMAVLTGPNGLETMSLILSCFIEPGEVRPEELAALFRELGPEVQEAYMTITEQITAQARAQALIEGEVKGQVSMLLKVLALRFGPPSEAVRARVQSGSLEELDRWAARLFSAATADDALA